MSHSIGIIGGADGPTAIFVTGSPAAVILPVIGLLAIVLLAIVLLILWLCKRK